LQQFSADLAAGMGHQEGLVLRIHFLATEAVVLRGLLRRLVVPAALGTAPVQGFLALGRHKLAQVIVVPLAGLAVLLLRRLHLHLHHTVVGPPLDAVQVEEAVAALTGPNGLHPADASDADEASGCSRVEGVLQERTGAGRILGDPCALRGSVVLVQEFYIMCER